MAGTLERLGARASAVTETAFARLFDRLKGTGWGIDDAYCYTSTSILTSLLR